jgi:hypothetical protein
MINTARQRYRNHKGLATRRGIAWQLTFDEWNKWWLANGVDKSFPVDSTRKSCEVDLCMCRHNDTGPYSLDNIYCATKRQNTIDSFKNGKQSGFLNSRKKSVTTPYGKFPSGIAAASELGIHPSTLKQRMAYHPTEYYYD